MVQQLRMLAVTEDLGLVPRFTEWLKIDSSRRSYALYWPHGYCMHMVNVPTLTRTHRSNVVGSDA